MMCICVFFPLRRILIHTLRHIKSGFLKAETNETTYSIILVYRDANVLYVRTRVKIAWYDDICGAKTNKRNNGL